MRSLIFSTPTVILLLSGCTPFKMAVHDDLKPAYDEYQVKGRQGILIKQKMSFGEYSTNTVKRSWTQGTSSRSGIGQVDPNQMEWINIISVEYMDKKQTIHYEMSSGGLHSQVYCVSRFNAENLEIGRNRTSLLNLGMDVMGKGGPYSSMYYVQIFASATDDRPWELALDNHQSQASASKYVGYLAKSKDDYYTIVPVSKLERNGKVGNSFAGSVGFEFRSKEGKIVAAVSLIDKGMVYLGKTTAEERFLLANACTALLLQETIG